MDATLFAKMLSDKSITDLKKMRYKYSSADVLELVSVLKGTMYQQLPIQDFKKTSLVYLENVTQVRMSSIKLLLNPHRDSTNYGMKAMEDEIHSTLFIENIESSRDSIRRILSGYAPLDESENRLFGMKKGLEFISDIANKITEKNIYRLYMLTVGDFLQDDDMLLSGNYYRHDDVFIIGGKVEHTRLPYFNLPEAMNELVEFINGENKMNDLLKAAAIHYYIAYLHPYFNGNGRMARLVHLWYLVQQGLFLHFVCSVFQRHQEE